MHTINRICLATLAFCAATLIPGCNVLAPVAYAVYGPGNVEKVFELNPDATTVVFVDDPSSRVAQRRLRYDIADRATRTLLTKEIVVDMLDSRTILAAASKERHTERLSITELGQSVGADIVIYAVVTNFSLTAESGTYLPTATMRVKIIDVASGSRVWPGAASGYLLEVNIPQRPGDVGSEGGRITVEQELAQRAGLGLAQMFYTHEITQTVRGIR